MEPCVVLDENPFRFWTGNSLFGVIFDDERLFNLARIPNPLRALELLWFTNSKTIQSKFGKAEASQTIEDVRSFGTRVLSNMNKWRDFSAAYPEAQLLFMAACDVLIIFLVETVKLCRRALRVDFFGESFSDGDIHAFIKSGLRCIHQLLVPRTILSRKAQRGRSGTSYQSLAGCLSTVKHIRPGMAPQLKCTIEAVQSVRQSYRKITKAPAWWQFAQDVCELEIEPLVESVILPSMDPVPSQHLLFNFGVRDNWVDWYEIGGSYHFGFLMSSANTALHQAVAYNNIIAMEILLGRRAWMSLDGVSRWHPIAATGLAKSQLMLTSKAFEDRPVQLCQRPEIAFHEIQQNGVECLSLRSCNVNAANDDGETALHLAARFGRPAFVEMLIDEGADVNALDCQGCTVLHHLGLAVQASELDLHLCAQLLSEASKRLSQRSICEASGVPQTLHGVARSLSGVDLEARTYKGDTVLHIAAREGNATIIETFMEAGANVNATNHAGDTPLHLAAAKADHRTWKFATAPIHRDLSSGDHRNTPMSCPKPDVDTGPIPALIKAGADVHIENGNGGSVVDIAMKGFARGDSEMLLALIGAGCAAEEFFAPSKRSQSRRQSHEGSVRD